MDRKKSRTRGEMRAAYKMLVRKLQNWENNYEMDITETEPAEDSLVQGHYFIWQLTSLLHSNRLM
jgi:hypothetical protein